jgi:hypothetical protein
MKAVITKNSKVGVISFFTGLVFLLTGFIIGNNIPGRSENFFFSFITVLGFLMALGGLLIFLYPLVKEEQFDKERRKAEKTTQKKIKEQLFRNMGRYDDAQQNFLCLSDDTLLLIYECFIKKGYNNLERLALEKELKSRGLIKNSPMEDKLYSLKQEAFVE